VENATTIVIGQDHFIINGVPESCAFIIGAYENSYLSAGDVQLLNNQTTVLVKSPSSSILSQLQQLAANSTQS
jgi:hypothetical protein